MKTAPDDPVRPLEWTLRGRSVADRINPGYDHVMDNRCLEETAVRDLTEPAFSSDGQRWEALLNRDRRADGAFLYAFKSTGVYCRPSCSSRLPNRENVVFFTGSSAAEAAGFRPCKRCSPRGPSVRLKQTCCRHSLSPRRPERWGPWGLSVGWRAQAAALGTGSEGINRPHVRDAMARSR
jgi:hypothetical protein